MKNLLNKLNPKEDFFNMISLRFHRFQIYLDQLDNLELTREPLEYSVNTIEAIRLINAMMIGNKEIIKYLDRLKEEFLLSEVLVK